MSDEESPSRPRSVASDDGEAAKRVKRSQSESSEPKDDSASSEQPWQAIWSSEANAFYFWHKETNETTWVNPLADKVKVDEVKASEVDEVVHEDGGLDPELAYLDPHQYRTTGTGGSSSARAQFDKRTGRFIPLSDSTTLATAADGVRLPVNRAPDYVSEYSRGNRMMSAYFDVDGWKRQQEEAKKEEDYRPTKKDITRFKQKKVEKKKAKQRAWLLD